MAPIATYVFLDLETTGIPKEELNRTQITELSMIAVKRDHVLDTRAGASPRVQHKITLCFNPRKLVNPSCTEVTGLCNDLLEHETEFNMQVFTMLDNFLEVLTKPVCLIAHNGYNFDYPILQRHLEKLKVKFSDDLMCADSYFAFYNILEAKNVTKNNNDVAVKPDVLPEDKQTEIEDFHTAENTLSMRAVNETTPKSKRLVQRYPIKSRARRRFPWCDGKKPAVSYKLKHIYERLLNRAPIDAHRAENDCVMLLESTVALSEEFVEWVDNNHTPFLDVKPMTVGVPLGE